MLVLSIVVRDLKREMKLLDEVGFSGKLHGRDISDNERFFLDGMYYAYCRVYLMIKDYCPDESF